MKNLLATVVFALAAPLLGFAQDPFYLLFNSQCMDVVEYRYAYTEQSVFAFSAKPNATEQFLFMAGEGALQAPTLPPSTIDCRNLYLDDSFVDAINSQSRPMYIIQQVQGGYLMTPVVRATRMVQVGNGFTIRSSDYYFAFDPQVHNANTNLWVAGSQSSVFYRGQELRKCRYVYTFAREPLTAGRDLGVFEYAPGIGLLAERSGRTTQEAQQNQLLLHKVNDRLLSDYISMGCEGVTVPMSEIKPVFTTPPVTEDREAASVSISQASTTTTYSPSYTTVTTTSGVPVDCSQRSGKGYHVMQRGENLLAVSRRYNVPLRTLIKLNNITDPDRVEVCQVIMVSNTKDARAALRRAAGSSNVATHSIASPKSYSEISESSWTSKSPTTTTTYQGTTAYNGPQKHIVMEGETLESIGRRYGFTEERLRNMNNFSQEGIFYLSAGTELIVNDCSCGANGGGTITSHTTTTSSSTPALYNTAPTPTVTTVPAVTPSTSSSSEQLFFETRVTPTATNTSSSVVTTPPPATSNPPIQTQPTTLIVENTTTGTPPVTHSTPTTTTPPPAASTTAGTPAPNATAQRQPAYVMEHYIQTGETISSIATRFKVSPQEIALINGKDVSETLIPGQRLMIPRY